MSTLSSCVSSFVYMCVPCKFITIRLQQKFHMHDKEMLKSCSVTKLNFIANTFSQLLWYMAIKKYSCRRQRCLNYLTIYLFSINYLPITQCKKKKKNFDTFDTLTNINLWWCINLGILVSSAGLINKKEWRLKSFTAFVQSKYVVNLYLCCCTISHWSSSVRHSDFHLVL